MNRAASEAPVEEKPAVAPRGLARGLPRRHAFWLRFCVAAIAGSLALHAIYHVSLPLPSVVTQILGPLLFVEFFLSWGLGLATAAGWIAAALVIALLSLVRRRWFFRTLTGPDGSTRRAARAWVCTFVWTALLAGHLAFDIDPRLFAFALSGAAIPLIDAYARPLPRGAWAAPVGFVALAFGWTRLARDAADWIGLVVLALGFAPILLVVARRRVARDTLALALMVTAVAQASAAFVPALLPFHRGTKLGRGMAYSFCEARDGNLYAAVPQCSPNRVDVCERSSAVVVYDATSLELVTRLTFFDRHFAGRLEQIACFDDVVEIGMDSTRLDGEFLRHNLMAFQLDDPTQFTENVLGEDGGDGATYDRTHDTSYYQSTENIVLRRNRRTGEIDALPGENIGELMEASVGDLGIHQGRNSLLVSALSRKVFELDLDTMDVRGAYSYLNSWELAVDEELERVYLSGNFGLEVLDLREGRITHRRRLGLSGRRPTLDAARDLLYVPSTGGGRLHVFDRHDLTLLGTLPIGAGMRYAYLSKDGRRLFVSGALHHYWFDADELASRFRRP